MRYPSLVSLAFLTLSSIGMAVELPDNSGSVNSDKTVCRCCPPIKYLNQSKNLMEVAILVNGMPIPEFYHERHRHIVVPKTGVEYTIQVKNLSDKRVLLVASVDGLSVMNGEVFSGKGGSGYVIAPYSTFEIQGWRRGTDQIATFLFESPENSDAAHKGVDSQIGTIRLIAIMEKVETPILSSVHAPASRAIGQPGTGTASGRELISKVVNVEFRRSSIEQEINLIYDTAESFAKRGIQISDYSAKSTK